MAPIRRLLAGLKALIRGHRVEQELDEELRAYVETSVEAKIRAGMKRDDAVRAAQIQSGSFEAVKDRVRDVGWESVVETAWRDVRYAARMLRRHPIWTATATLSLAVGIGLNAAVFSVVDWVLLRPLPYPASHELVHIFTAGRAPVTGPSGVTHEEFVTFSRAATVRQAIGFSNTTRILSGGAIEPVHVMVSRVVGDFFATFGVHPDVGRPFGQEEMAAGMPVVVLGHELWQRSFVADPQVVGRTVLIDGAPHTIIGVMPAGRGYPRDAEVWRPLTPAERASDDRDLSMVARLGSGVTSATASVELGTLAQAVSNDIRTAWVDEVRRTDVGSIKASLQALFAAAMLTLLIACANVAALVGAKNGDRIGEVAIRGALGASPGRIFRQLITESLMLAIAGGLLGLLFGRWALSALVAMAPVSVPRLTEISLDGRILAIGLVSTGVDRPGCRPRTGTSASRRDANVGAKPVGMASYDAAAARPSRVSAGTSRRGGRSGEWCWTSHSQSLPARDPQSRLRSGSAHRCPCISAATIQRRRAAAPSRAGRRERECSWCRGSCFFNAAPDAGIGSTYVSERGQRR